MSIDDYKKSFETSIIQTMLNESRTILPANFGKEFFKEIENNLIHELQLLNEAFGQESIQNCKDSIVRISNYLYKREFPEFYEPFKEYNFFNNLLGIIGELAKKKTENQGKSDEEEMSLLIETFKLLSIISDSHRDCCEFLDNIGFFDVIDQFINSWRGSKYASSPRIEKEYAYSLINTLANIASYKEYNCKLTESIIKYVLLSFQTAPDIENYIEPLGFFRNFFIRYQKTQEEQVKKLLGEILSVLGDFPCSERLVKMNRDREKLIIEIHQTTSCIIYLLSSLELLIETDFFYHGIDKYIRNYYLSDKYLMLAIGYIAKNHKSIFDKLELSLEDICEGFKNEGKGLKDESEYMQFTYATIYYVLYQTKDMLDSELIRRIINFICERFENDEYKVKYRSFNLLCYIYIENTKLYLENIAVVLLLLENCSLFISEDDEVNNNFLRFLNNFHSFLERNTENEHYLELARSFNDCIEMILANKEYYDQSLIEKIAPFEIEPPQQ